MSYRHLSLTVRSLGLLLVALALAFFSVQTSQADVTQEQKEAVARLTEQLKEAGRLVTQKKVPDAIAIAEKAQTEIALLAAAAESDAQLKRAVDPLVARLEVIRRVVKRAGAELAAWPAADAPGTISFSSEIVPIFLAKCNNCHVRGNRGGFNMANYNALMEGSTGGIVVRPKDGAGSRLIDVLESGDMPRGGTMSQEEIASIKKWIDEGARFDGTDKGAALAQLVPAGNPAAGNAMPAAAPELVKATGKEKVLFARDIAPVITAQCINCHGANNASGQLGLDTFARLLQGGQGGAIIVPGKPTDSLLIKKLNGTADGQRMPLRRPPLDAKTMELFETWISEGAKFDGPDGGTPTETVAQLYRASQMTFDELSAERATAADQTWRTAHPNVQPDRHQSEHFLLLGTVGDTRLERLAKVAEEAWGKVAQGVRLRGDEWPLGGKVTLFAFDRRFEFSEFGRMVERRDLPKEVSASRMYNVVDAYIALALDESATAETLAPVMMEHLAGMYLGSLSDAPGWYARGLARELTAKAYPRDPAVRSWIENGPAAKAQLPNGAALLNGNLPADSAAELEYNFAAFLSQNTKAWQALLKSLKEKQPFDAAFAQAFGGTPAQAVDVWKRQ